MAEQRVVPEQRMGEAGPDGRAREQEAAARLRRRRLRKRTLAAAVATAAAAGGTAALLVAHASHPPTAFTTVTSALARTSADSYSFALRATAHFGGKQVRSDVASGAYDSRHRVGTELLVARASHGSPVRMQVRFAGRYVFTQIAPGSGFGKPWNKSPIPSSGVAAMPPNDVYGFVTDRPVSPAELSGVLRSAGKVRVVGPASGPGWTGTRYAFTARFPGVLESVSGTVDIDQRGRVRRVMTITTQGRYEKVTTDRDLTFGNLGAPVPVTVPPAGQVEYTSRPYAGYLF